MVMQIGSTGVDDLAQMMSYSPQARAMNDAQLANAMQMRTVDPWTAIGKAINIIAAKRGQKKLDEAQTQSEAAKKQAIDDYLGGRGDVQSLVRALGPREAREVVGLGPQQAEQQERFEMVESPYGRGGIGQRSSLTGKISGYQPPQKEPGPGKLTAMYHPDTGEQMAVTEREALAMAEKGFLPGTPDKRKEFQQQPDKLRAEFQKQSGKFVDTQNAFRTVTALLDRGTPAGDHSAIFAYMKVIDPTSTVREGEYATVENTGSWSDRLRQTYNKAVGGEKLTPEQRKDFQTSAAQMYLGAVGEQERNREYYEGLAQRHGIDTRDIGRAYIDQDLYQRFLGGDRPYEVKVQLGGTGEDQPVRSGPKEMGIGPEAAIGREAVQPPQLPDLTAMDDAEFAQFQTPEMMANFSPEQLQTLATEWDRRQQEQESQFALTASPIPGAEPRGPDPRARPEMPLVPGAGATGPDPRNRPGAGPGAPFPSGPVPRAQPDFPVPGVGGGPDPRARPDDFPVPGVGGGPVPRERVPPSPLPGLQEHDRRVFERAGLAVQGALEEAPMPAATKQQISELLSVGDVHGALRILQSNVMPDRPETWRVRERLAFLAEMMGG